MKYFISTIIIPLIFLGCARENDHEIVPNKNDNSVRFELKILHKTGNSDLIPEATIFRNVAGNSLNVRRLQYYLSNIELIRPDSTTLKIADYYYVDFSRKEFCQINWDHKLTEHFIGMKFCIGLDSVHNQTFCLPASNENNDMAWPAPMGGGYHFLKMEGNYYDSSLTYGYTIHLGTNACMVPVICWKDINLDSMNNSLMSLIMNVNEWYQSPLTYDFNSEPLHTMGNIAAMQMITANGKDVFTLQY